ncbi:Ribonucleoprotein PTB-binding 2 [Manis javanica]|nr:Ribonucleoprotein PTB-binding 2 [Manis javanica]
MGPRELALGGGLAAPVPGAGYGALSRPPPPPTNRGRRGTAAPIGSARSRAARGACSPSCAQASTAFRPPGSFSPQPCSLQECPRGSGVRFSGEEPSQVQSSLGHSTGTSVGRIRTELQASHSHVSLHLIPRKVPSSLFHAPLALPSQAWQALCVGCPRIRGSAAASQTPSLALLGFRPPGYSPWSRLGPQVGPGPWQNMKDSGCLLAKSPAEPDTGPTLPFHPTALLLDSQCYFCQMPAACYGCGPDSPEKTAAAPLALLFGVFPAPEESLTQMSQDLPEASSQNSWLEA